MDYYEFQRMAKIGRIIEVFKNLEGKEFTRRQVSFLLEDKDLSFKWVQSHGHRPARGKYQPFLEVVRKEPVHTGEYDMHDVVVSVADGKVIDDISASDFTWSPSTRRLAEKLYGKCEVRTEYTEIIGVRFYYKLNFDALRNAYNPNEIKSYYNRKIEELQNKIDKIKAELEYV